GERTIERSEIKEIIREESADDAVRKKIDFAKSADELVELAKKLEAEKKPSLARAALERAVKLDPEHAAARAALGQKKVDGQWLNEREWKKKEGWQEDPKTHELVSPEDWAKRQKADAEGAQEKYKKEKEGTGDWIVKETKNY